MNLTGDIEPCTGAPGYLHALLPKAKTTIIMKQLLGYIWTIGNSLIRATFVSYTENVQKMLKKFFKFPEKRDTTSVAKETIHKEWETTFIIIQNVGETQQIGEEERKLQTYWVEYEKATQR